MAADPIRRGTPQANRTIEMIDAYLRDDLHLLEALLDQVVDDYGEVFWWFIVLLGGTIEGIAIQAGQKFDDVLPLLLTQIAGRSDAVPDSDVARRALTAWSTGDDKLVTGLNFDEEIQSAGPGLVLMNLLGMLVMISRSWAEQGGTSLAEIRSGWVTALGANDGN